MTPSGQIKEWARGLTIVLGLAFGTRDRLYALESMTAPGAPGTGVSFGFAGPGAGQILRITIPE